ncbi:hypothetical protein NE646_14635, partial [Bittarella massiliensis]|nr:hypothetical protein [Bittarella massiliensis (ex Durand et al. 2017)]
GYWGYYGHTGMDIAAPSGTAIFLPQRSLFFQGGQGHGQHQPVFDWFCNHALAYMIREKKPDVFFQHLSAVDHARHNLGVFAEVLKRDAWIQQDKEFGMI